MPIKFCLSALERGEACAAAVVLGTCSKPPTGAASTVELTSAGSRAMDGRAVSVARETKFSLLSLSHLRAANGQVSKRHPSPKATDHGLASIRVSNLRTSFPAWVSEIGGLCRTDSGFRIAVEIKMASLLPICPPSSKSARGCLQSHEM